MDILLIYPHLEHGVTTREDSHTPFSKLFGNPSLTLPQIAAVTPEKHNVRILDENFEPVRYDGDWDLVGISCLTMTAPYAYRMADRFRERGIPVVLGGYHPTACPEEASQHADAIVIGEGEGGWPELLHDLENNGKLKQFYGRDSCVQPEQIPEPRMDLVRYQPLTGCIQTQRGCPHACEFCSTSAFLGRQVRARPIPNVVAEMKKIPNKLIIFRDASLTINPPYSRKLFNEMIRQDLNKKWIANGNINMLSRDEEFLDLAREAGCIAWFVGIESISPESLKEAHKTSNTASKYRQAIKTIRDHGMAVIAGIIFGFDHDTPDIFDTTLEKMLEWEIDVGEFNILTPYPGTALFDRLDEEDRIFTKDWSKYTQSNVVYEPKNMTPEELMEGTKRVIDGYYNVPQSLKRVLGTMKISKLAPTSLVVPSINFAMRRYYYREFF
ncbi:MAG: B12-binding domain-containing radical SAM protein [Candidatus Thermoplasmatota archaeon]|nr:B12-binding domain-containing radical SAM protein [Candidatus Thermoplasmatota archaeon]